MISEITTFLTHDVRHILGEEDEGSVAVGLLVPQIDASLLMPSIATATEVHGERETVQSQFRFPLLQERISKLHMHWERGLDIRKYDFCRQH